MADGSTWTVATQWEEHHRFDTASEAEAYAERLCTAIYGYQNETGHQLPFHAFDEGETWRVIGSRPYGWPSNPLTGPLTFIFDKASGKVTDVHFTGAPAGWDAAIRRKLDGDAATHLKR